MENLLIITHYFEKDGIMGSVRWTNFAHRLSKDYNVFVLTHGDGVSEKEFKVKQSKNVKVIEVDNLCSYVKNSQKRHANSNPVSYSANSASNAKTSLKSKVKAILRSVLQTLSLKKTAKKNYNVVKKYLKENGIKFDYVISTSRPFINSYTAKHFAVNHKAKWILDQRDLPLSEEATNVEFKLFKKEFKKLDKHVFRYTIVSKGMKDGLGYLYDFSPKMMDKVYVLYNGYTQADKRDKEPPISNDKLTFAFTGDLYAGKRDLTMLLDAIRQLIDQSKCSEQDFLVNYAGGAVESLNEQAKPFNLERIINNNGKVSHEQAVKLQNSSDILLLPTWNTQRDQGILTGKIYEYMLAEKPILTITAGEIPNGEATQTINELNLGIAVETCDYENGVSKLQDYLLMQLQNKKQSKELCFSPDKEGIKRFDHDNLVEEIKNILRAEK